MAVATAEALKRFTSDVFVRAGMVAAQAGIVADVLVWANLRGVDSHGVARIPQYLDLIDSGDLNPNADVRTAMESAASVLIEADRAAGPVAMVTAMAAAVRKAREAGVGLALVRGTAHTGALGYYTLSAAQDGMAAMALAALVPAMAYHGSRAAGVSTNPISIAVPGGDHGAVVLDMATGVGSVGKVLQARATGESIPAGWALDADGNPTTDAAAARILMPLGGPKGSGLALMIECITSLIVSNPILAEALGGTAHGRHYRQNGLALAIDLGRFCDPESFRSQVARLIKALKALPRQPDVLEILMPGERGSRTFVQRSRHGIPIPPPLLDRLTAVADRLGVTMSL